MKLSDTMHYFNNQQLLRDLFWDTLPNREQSFRVLAKEVDICYPQFYGWFTKNKDLSYKSVVKILNFVEKNLKGAKTA
jgi:hypothetical protein